MISMVRVGQINFSPVFCFADYIQVGLHSANKDAVNRLQKMETKTFTKLDKMPSIEVRPNALA